MGVGVGQLGAIQPPVRPPKPPTHSEDDYLPRSPPRSICPLQGLGGGGSGLEETLSSSLLWAHGEATGSDQHTHPHTHTHSLGVC